MAVAVRAMVTRSVSARAQKMGKEHITVSGQEGRVRLEAHRNRQWIEAEPDKQPDMVDRVMGCA